MAFFFAMLNYCCVEMQGVSFSRQTDRLVFINRFRIHWATFGMLHAFVTFTMFVHVKENV